MSVLEAEQPRYVPGMTWGGSTKQVRVVYRIVHQILSTKFASRVNGVHRIISIVSLQMYSFAELPYRSINVTVVFGSEQQSRIVRPYYSIENEFTFDTQHFESNNYTLMVMFSGSDGFNDGKGMAINTYNETIEIIEPEPEPPAPSMANKHFTSSFVFAVFSLIFIYIANQ